MTIPTDKPLAVPAFDYHTHHRRCGHAQGEMANYIEAGIALGLREIGVSDHCPFLFLHGDHPQPGTAMAASELPNYVAQARQLQERFAGRIAVRVGIEADFVPGFEDVYREALAAHPLDYVLGSVHFVNGRHIFDRTRWAPTDAASTSHECAPGPRARNAFSSAVRALGCGGLGDPSGCWGWSG